MEAQFAIEYGERDAQAVYSVLVEIGQVLGAYRDRFVIIGGSVPWLLFPDAQPQHVGTLDVDISLDPGALGEGEYAGLVELLERAGYERSQAAMKVFQLRRHVRVDDGAPLTVIVDLLMPREAKFKRNKPPLLANFAVQKADGAGVAMREYVRHRIEGRMPDGRPNAVELRVANIPAFLVMKGYALRNRDKRKDAYDIYFAIRHYTGGPESLADSCRPLLDDPIAREGYTCIAEKFASGFGQRTVRDFLADSGALGDMTADQVEVDANGQVGAWLRCLGLGAR